MTHSYKAIGWNRQKKIYDRVLVAGVLAYLLVFVGLGFALRPNATIETMLIRALGTGAFLLLHVILSIGPLARLDSRFLPWLYNRRHLGVTMFVLALGHGGFSLVQFHALGDRSPLASALAPAQGWTSLAEFPFQPLGIAALAILFLMAATSHDFWLTNLTAPIWKRLHMLVYLAYALLIGHVVLGVLQSETSPVLAGVLALGLVWVVALHLVAAWRERGPDRAALAAGPAADSGYVDAGPVDEIPEGRAKIVTIAGDRVAVFRYDGKISALSNACQHQNGPLGEGRIRNGCVVCPWHGYEYRPESGQSPPPFTEKVPTFDVRVEAGRVWVDPRPNAPGTPVEPAAVEIAKARATSGRAGDEFYIGYREEAPSALARFSRRSAAAVLAGALGIAALLTASQAPFAASTFEFGVPRTVAGVVRLDPYPVLGVERPGRTELGQAVSRYLLVGQGKFGAGGEVAALDGRSATLDGSLIYADGLTMIEVVPGSARGGAAAAGGGEELSLGVHTLRGEIVDSKCYLGVMKPGRGKAHRACAANCIRGGAPPLFLVTDGEGRREGLLLVDSSGAAVNDRVLAWIAEPIEISGEVTRRDDLLYLEADPDTYRRLGER